MHLTYFNCNYVNKLFDNISKKYNKNLFCYREIVTSWIDGNFLNYNECNKTNEFLDSLASNSFIPLILEPTRIINHSNTLKDIFLKVVDPDIISDNLTATISDHLPQFVIIPNTFGNILGNKSDIYE